MGKLREELGSRLKELRNERKMSTRKVEDISGIDHSNIVRIESGKTNCTIDVLERLLDAIDGQITINKK